MSLKPTFEPPISMKPEYDCPMLKKWSILLVFSILSVATYAQKNSGDSVISPAPVRLLSDTIIDDMLDEDLFQKDELVDERIEKATAASGPGSNFVNDKER